MKRLHTSDATHHPPEVLDAVACARVDVTTAEAQGVGADTIGPRSGPIVSVGSTVVDRRTIHDPGIDKVVRICTP